MSGVMKGVIRLVEPYLRKWRGTKVDEDTTKAEEYFGDLIRRETSGDELVTPPGVPAPGINNLNREPSAIPQPQPVVIDSNDNVAESMDFEETPDMPDLIHPSTPMVDVEMPHDGDVEPGTTTMEIAGNNHGDPRWVRAEKSSVVDGQERQEVEPVIPRAPSNNDNEVRSDQRHEIQAATADAQLSQSAPIIQSAPNPAEIVNGAQKFHMEMKQGFPRDQSPLTNVNQPHFDPNIAAQQQRMSSTLQRMSSTNLYHPVSAHQNHDLGSAQDQVGSTQHQPMNTNSVFPIEPEPTTSGSSMLYTDQPNQERRQNNSPRYQPYRKSRRIPPQDVSSRHHEVYQDEIGNTYCQPVYTVVPNPAHQHPSHLQSNAHQTATGAGSKIAIANGSSTTERTPPYSSHSSPTCSTTPSTFDGKLLTPEKEEKRKAANRGYSAKSLKKEKDTLDASVDQVSTNENTLKSFQADIADKERLAYMVVQLCPLEECVTAKNTYEAKRNDSYSLLKPDKRQEMETLKQDCFLRHKSAQQTFCNREKEYTNAKSGTAGSRKSRAKSAMKLAKANLDNAGLYYKVCVQKELLKLVDVFLAETVPRIASRVMSPTQDLLHWVDQNGKKEDWERLRAYVIESTRAPDATRYQSGIS